jgi:hypothetical protein
MRRLSIVLVGFLAACDWPGIFGSDDIDRLRKRRQQWDALAIRDYDFDYQRSCFCDPASIVPVRIEVRDDLVFRVLHRTTGEDLTALHYAGWPTIDSLFVRTERNARGDYNLEIDYDPRFYFPSRVVADIPMMADDEYFLHAGNLIRR